MILSGKRSRQEKMMISNAKKIKRVKIGQKKVVIIFDDLDKLEIHPNVYTEYNLFPNKILSKKDISEIKKRNELEVYISYAMKLCSSRSYSKAKIKEKLVKKGANEAQIEAVIDLLVKYQLIDEKALIKEILEYSDYKHFGFNRIKEEMYKKGISSFYIDKLVYDEARDISHAKCLIKPLEKKYSKYNYSLMKKHIYDSLLRSGYTYDVASTTLEDVSPIDIKKEKELLKIDYSKAKNRYKDKYGPYEYKEKINQYLIQKGYRYVDIKELKE